MQGEKESRPLDIRNRVTHHQTKGAPRGWGEEGGTVQGHVSQCAHLSTDREGEALASALMGQVTEVDSKED